MRQDCVLGKEETSNGSQVLSKGEVVEGGVVGFVTQKRSCTGSPKRDVGLDCKPPDVEVEKEVIRAKRPLKKRKKLNGKDEGPLGATPASVVFCLPRIHLA